MKPLLIFALALAFPSLTPAQILTGNGELLYGVSNGRGTPANNLIYRINPANGDLSNFHTLHCVVDGCTVTSIRALAARPSNGQLFGVAQLEGSVRDYLVIINPVNGNCQPVGILDGFGEDEPFKALSFNSAGVLYAMAERPDIENPPTEEDLFTVNTSTAGTTVVLRDSINPGEVTLGEAIAFHPNGLLYRSTGVCPAFFQVIDTDRITVTTISDYNCTTVTAMGYSQAQGAMFLTNISPDVPPDSPYQILFRVNVTTGSRTFVGVISDQLPAPLSGGLELVNTGLAFVPATPSCTSCGTE